MSRRSSQTYPARGNLLSQSEETQTLALRKIESYTESNKRSKCLITLFAILLIDKSEETMRIFNDLSSGNKDILHLLKKVYLPENQKDDCLQ